MAVRLLSHASCPAVSSTPASRTSSLRALSSGRPAPPAKQSSSSSSPPVTDKVLCVCGAVSDDGKAMVECTKCGAWSHLQCARLTQRTARKSPFFCHRCKTGSGGHATLASRRKEIEGVGLSTRRVSKELPKSKPKTVLKLPKSLSTQPSRPTPPPLSSIISTNYHIIFLKPPPFILPQIPILLFLFLIPNQFHRLFTPYKMLQPQLYQATLCQYQNVLTIHPLYPLCILWLQMLPL